MTEQEIIDGNKLISEFMGGIINGNICTFHGGWENDNQKFLSDLKYHSSWDWLMPVVEKISQHVYEEQEQDNGIEKEIIKHRAYPRTFGMISKNNKWMFRFNASSLYEEDTLIEAAWKSCVDWIEFNNSNKKSKINEANSI